MKIAIVAFLLLYLGTSAGFAMNFHFCGKKLALVQINSPVKKSCCKKTEGKADKCCKDKHVRIKVSDQQHASQISKVPAVQKFDLFSLPVSFSLTLTHDEEFFAERFSRPPPGEPRVPLHLKFCVFRI